MEAKACGLHRLVVDVLPSCKRQVLLVKYRDASKYDSQTGWFVPDDFMKHVEHPEEGARRILAEQFGLTARTLTLGYLESFNGEDSPWHLIFHYQAPFDTRPAIVLGDNVAAAEWFSVESLPPRAEMAHHGWTSDIVAKLMTVGT